MPRALLALAFVFSLGNPAAQSWMDTLIQLASDYGGLWDPNGSGAQSDFGNQWDPNGAGAQSDYGSQWDPNG